MNRAAPPHRPPDLPAFDLWSGLTAYPAALARMQERAGEIRAGRAGEQIILTEHPPVYTGGTSARDEELRTPDGKLRARDGKLRARDEELRDNMAAEVVRTGRGGQWTWHGPGQRIIWPLLRLDMRGGDVREFVRGLEGWMIDMLACFAIEGVRRDGLPGVWVARRDIGLPDRLDKIAALGIRVSGWVSQHGLAVNLDPDLTGFDGIVPCGVSAEAGGVTSLADLGLLVSMAELDMAIKDTARHWFGPGKPLGLR
jgi:lipoyl(octanoyl) transferase